MARFRKVIFEEPGKAREIMEPVGALRTVAAKDLSTSEYKSIQDDEVAQGENFADELFPRDCEQPNEESLVAIREAEEAIGQGSAKTYDNAHELLRAALS